MPNDDDKLSRMARELTTQRARVGNKEITFIEAHELYKQGKISYEQLVEIRQKKTTGKHISKEKVERYIAATTGRPPRQPPPNLCEQLTPEQLLKITPHYTETRLKLIRLLAAQIPPYAHMVQNSMPLDEVHVMAVQIHAAGYMSEQHYLKIKNMLQAKCVLKHTRRSRRA